MVVPDLLVVLILIFEKDQVGNFGFGEVVVVPENVDGAPDFVLSLIPECKSLGVGSGVLGRPAGRRRPAIDLAKEVGEYRAELCFVLCGEYTLSTCSS